MKLKIDANGWTVHASELDPRSVTDDELQILRTIPYTNVVLVLHDLPTLTSDQYQEFCHKVFYKLQNDNPEKEKKFLPGHNKEILRVTGRKNEQGEILGVFGMPNFLPWHCNQPGIPLDQRPDCLTLYSVEHCEGSITAFSNSILALQDIRIANTVPDGLLEVLDRLEVYYHYSVDLDLNSQNVNYEGYSGRNKLVVQNKSNQQGLLFGNGQAESFWIDDQRISDQMYQSWQLYLGKFLIQKQYVYAHRWKNNQMVMNCQVLGQHARLPFANIEKRLLWRAMGYVQPFDRLAIDTSQLEMYQ